MSVNESAERTPAEVPAKKATPKRRPKKGRSPKTRKSTAGGRQRGRKPYPVISFEQALRIGQGIADFGAGHPMKRITLLEKLELTDNQHTRGLITASNKYGITTGGYQAPEFALTEEGVRAVSPTASLDRTKARIKLAIENVEPFNKLYQKFAGGKMPSVEVMRDALDDMDEGDRAPCVDIFVQNAKFTGILQTKEGAEFVTSLDEVMTGAVGTTISQAMPLPLNQPVAGEDFETVCFFISPIGTEDSDHRKHSDAILASYVEKALETVEPKLRVVRADKITQPGMITKQVLEYLTKSRLVIADLSFHNPNVFYELAVRHATGKPVVHVKRTSDAIPFDNKEFRTIDIAFDDKFDILAQLETVRSTIAMYSRQALAVSDSSDNPLLIYFPDYRFRAR